MKNLVFVSILIFSVAGFAGVTKSKFEINQMKLKCYGANGVTIESTGKPNLVSTKWFGYTKEFSAELNPMFFQWTWIALAEPGQITASGHQIFLLGNAPENKEMVLYGSVGKVISVPTPGGLKYPVGFMPETALSCKILWSSQKAKRN